MITLSHMSPGEDVGQFVEREVEGKKGRFSLLAVLTKVDNPNQLITFITRRGEQVLPEIKLNEWSDSAIQNFAAFAKERVCEFVGISIAEGSWELSPFVYATTNRSEPSFGFFRGIIRPEYPTHSPGDNPYPIIYNDRDSFLTGLLATRRLAQQPSERIIGSTVMPKANELMFLAAQGNLFPKNR